MTMNPPVVGCIDKCEDGMFTTDQCKKICPIRHDVIKNNRGTCFMRCNADFEIGYTEHAKMVIAGTAPVLWKGTGYPANGPPKNAGSCSCDVGCVSRIDVTGRDDCCVDREELCF